MLEEWVIHEIQRRERERREQENAFLPLYAPMPELRPELREQRDEEEDEDDNSGHVIEIDI
jgi:hypothetical protein